MKFNTSPIPAYIDKRRNSQGIITPLLGSQPPVTPPPESHRIIPCKYDYSSKYVVLAAGIDTLVLSVYVDWEDTLFFDHLEGLLSKAHKQREPQYIGGEYQDPFLFKVQEFSMRNYRYVLEAHGFTLKIAPIQYADTMPNLIIEIKSITLWGLGIDEASRRVLSYIGSLVDSIKKVCVNRHDPCMDIAIPRKEWSPRIKDKRVCRSKKVQTFMHREAGKDVLETLNIGAGDLLVRIYDKELEIRKHPEKAWTYSLWDMEKVRKGSIIIRVEFQLRRPVLKEFEIDTLDDLIAKNDALWSYLTHWVKFLRKPERNRDRQQILPWWQVIQSGYSEYCEPVPRIRHEAARMDRETMAKRALAIIENLMASSIASYGMPPNNILTLNGCFDELAYQLHALGVTDTGVSNNVKSKISRYKIT